MIAEVLQALLAANLAGGAAVLAVLALRPVVRPRFGARAAYALWIVPALAAVTAAVPHSQAAASAAPFVATAEAAVRALPAPASHPALTPDLIAAVWLAGALAMAAWLSLQQARFARAARNGEAGPAVIGLLRPRIVTPADFDATFAPEERRLILAHETAHVAGGDPGVNALACAFRCLAWFNPLAHVAVHLLRIDQELACDASVIDRFPAARRTYAELLLKTQIAGQAPPLGCQWPARAEHPLKERIAMLKTSLPGRDMRRVGLAVAALMGLGAAGLAWSATAQAETPSVILQPVWLKKPTGQDIARLYPPHAAAARMEFTGALDCRVAADGTLEACKTDGVRSADKVSEPRDSGELKTAMMQLSKLFQMAPESRNGVKTAGGEVRIPVIWRMPAQAN